METGDRARVARGLHIDRVWAIEAWVVPATAVLLSRVPTEDLAYQVRAGALILSRGAFLRTDPFTFTIRGAPWTDQQWGAQVFLDALHRPAGWAGLVILWAALVTAVFGALFVRTRRASGDAMVAAGLTLGALIVTLCLPGALALRPQLLAAPLFLGATWLLRRRSDHPWGLAWLPLMAVVWANLHGSFVLLPVLTAVAFVADVAGRAASRRRTGFTLLACVLGTMVNPWGPGIYGYVVRVSTAPIVRRVIDEWQPLWRRFPGGPAFLLAVVVVAAMVVRRRRRMPTLEEVLGSALFTVLAVTSGRNVLWWSLYMPEIVGALIAPRRAREPDRSPLALVVTGLLVAGLALGVVRVVTAQPEESLLTDAPQGVTAALARNMSGGERVFDGWWGSWFEYALPGVPMFVDSRAEIFPTSIWDDYFTISLARPGWDAALDRWGIDVIVASPDHQAALIASLATDAAWRETYRDADGTVFVRR